MLHSTIMFANGQERYQMFLQEADVERIYKQLHKSSLRQRRGDFLIGLGRKLQILARSQWSAPAYRAK